MHLEDQVTTLQKRLATIEAYTKISEWINNSIPSQKVLVKTIPNEDVLLTVAQDLAHYARMKAEHLAGGNESDIKMLYLTNDEIDSLRQIIQAFKSRKAS